MWLLILLSLKGKMNVNIESIANIGAGLGTSLEEDWTLLAFVPSTEELEKKFVSSGVPCVRKDTSRTKSPESFSKKASLSFKCLDMASKALENGDFKSAEIFEECAGLLIEEL